MCRARPDSSIARLFARGIRQISGAECAAHDAPLPSGAHRAATRAFPEMVPARPGADGVDVSRRAAVYWAREWHGRSMMAVGERDPVFTPALMNQLRQGIRDCPPPLLVAEGGHFVQEHGAIVAKAALRALG
jgi:pimeloyl-ACP methyl ester carboxylesterase